MSYVMWYVCMCVYLCVAHTDLRYRAKTAEPIEMPFERQTHVVLRNHILDGVKIGRMHSQLQGVTSQRWGFLPDYCGHLVFLLLKLLSLLLLVQ